MESASTKNKRYNPEVISVLIKNTDRPRYGLLLRLRTGKERNEMFETIFKMPVRLGLQFFADGAGATSGGASGGSAPAGAEAADAGLTQGTDGGTDHVGADTESGQAETPDREAEFERLIKGDYKDLYDARVKKAVTGRTRTLGRKAQAYESVLPIIDTLTARYNVPVGDTEALIKAVREDTAYKSVRADESGISEAQYDEMENLRIQAATRSRMENEAKAEEDYAALMNEARGVKAVYKNFDVAAELKNPEFVKLLDAGFKMRDAYEMVHRNELIPAAMKYASKKGEDAVMNRVRQNGARPAENGVGAQQAAAVKINPDNLSMEQINDYIRRAERGEKITFA